MFSSRMNIGPFLNVIRNKWAGMLLHITSYYISQINVQSGCGHVSRHTITLVQ